MKTVLLHGARANGQVALVDDEDYPVVSRYHWGIHYGHRSGRDSGPYAVATFNRRNAQPRYLAIPMHCLILACFSGIDHRNGDGFDNRKENLRIASASENAANQGPRVGTSQYKGVSWASRQKKWKAQLRKDGEVKYLGYFNDEKDAARAYDTAALSAWGDYAWLNFKEEST